VWQQCLPDAESSFSCAGVTYTTVGYGALVLPKEWRLLGPVDGLATGVFFALVSRIDPARNKTAPPDDMQRAS